MARGKSTRYQVDPVSGGMVPVLSTIGKVAGPQDFSGQDSGYPKSSPEGEVSTNHDGGTAGVNYRFIPSIDDPGHDEIKYELASDDPRLHLSRMSGTEATEEPNPSHYRGPDRRKI